VNVDCRLLWTLTVDVDLDCVHCVLTERGLLTWTVDCVNFVNVDLDFVDVDCVDMLTLDCVDSGLRGLWTV